MNDFYTVEIKGNSFNDIEAINRCAIENFGCEGIEEFNISEDKVDEILGERAYSGGDVPDSVINEIDELLSLEKGPKYFYRQKDKAEAFVSFLKTYDLEGSLETQENLDWNEKWKEDYKTIKISNAMAIIPIWLKEQESNKYPVPVLINPGQGFGTGTHETSFLCLEMLEKYKKVMNHDSCLDFGAGSGILAIAAKKIGFSNVELYDIDPAAMDNAIENIDHNFKEFETTEFSFFLPPDRDLIKKKYDLVFANILQNILLEEKNHLISTLKNGSFLILSGLLQEQLDSTANEYLEANPELKLVEKKTRGEWGVLVFQKS